MKKRKKGNAEIERERGINRLQEMIFGKGIVGVLEDVISKREKKRREFWASNARLFFMENVPKEIKNDYKKERIEFQERLRNLMGDQADQFWLEAFRYYKVYLDKPQEFRKSIRDEKYQYKDFQEKYDRAIKVLKKLYFKKFIIFPFPFFVTRPPLGYPRCLTTRKPLNLFVYRMGVTLGKYMAPIQSFKIMHNFLLYYLGYRKDDLDSIKKIIQRPPFSSKD